MVLHRLLFLRLPYESAQREELTGPERLHRLEREVLDYPGYAGGCWEGCAPAADGRD
jgi:hypothetical protein